MVGRSLVFMSIGFNCFALGCTARDFVHGLYVILCLFYCDEEESILLLQFGVLNDWFQVLGRYHLNLFILPNCSN